MFSVVKILMLIRYNKNDYLGNNKISIGRKRTPYLADKQNPTIIGLLISLFHENRKSKNLLDKFVRNQ